MASPPSLERTDLYTDFAFRVQLRARNADSESSKEIIQEVAEEMISMREVLLALYSAEKVRCKFSIQLLSEASLNPGQKLQLELLKQKLVKLQGAEEKGEADGFLEIESFETETKREIRTLQAWQKDPPPIDCTEGALERNFLQRGENSLP